MMRPCTGTSINGAVQGRIAAAPADQIRALGSAGPQGGLHRRTVLLTIPGAAMAALAFNPGAFDATQRLRYQELCARLKAAALNRRDTAEGYRLRLSGAAITLAELGEWMGYERLCCPFLTFQLQASGTDADWTLILAGPEGALPLLKVALG